MFIRHYDLLFPVIRESNIETNTQSKHSADVFCTAIPNMKLFLTWSCGKHLWGNLVESLVYCLSYAGYEQTPATNGTSCINYITCLTRLGINRLHFNHQLVVCVCGGGGGGGGMNIFNRRLYIEPVHACKYILTSSVIFFLTWVLWRSVLSIIMAYVNTCTASLLANCLPCSLCALASCVCVCVCVCVNECMCVCVWGGGGYSYQPMLWKGLQYPLNNGGFPQ